MATMPAFSRSDLADVTDWDYDGVIEALPLPILRLAFNGAIRAWNQDAERLLGYTRNTVWGAPGTMCVADSSIPAWNRCFEEVRSAGTIQEFQGYGQHRDGALVPLKFGFVPLKRESGLVAGILCMLREAHAGVSASLFPSSQLHLERIWEGSGVLVREWNPDSDELQYAGDVQGFLGTKGTGIKGGIDRWVEAIHPDDREFFMREFESVLSQRSRFDLEYRLRHANGSYKIVRDRGHLIVDASARITWMTALLTDITELRALEDRLRHSQKMEAFGRLAGGVAHDFNNLLTVISGYSEMMRDEFSETDPKRALIMEVEQAAHRAASLTGQLLAFSRQQAQKLRALNLNDVLTDIGKMLRRLIGEHIKLSIQLGDDLGRVRSDAGYIEQVLINLAVNARDAMPDGGTLHISTFNNVVTGGEIMAGGYVPSGNYVTLMVGDTGIGMSEEIRTRIFEPFFTTKAPGQGTGIGLTTCHNIIKQCHGYITVESKVNSGTTFRIYFPRVYEPENCGNSSGESVPAQGGNEIVMLVEDDLTVRKLSAAVLSRLGYGVIEAENGEEALELITTRGLRRVDLLITDMVMPKLGGLGLAAQINIRFPNTKILFTSGYPNHSVNPTNYSSRVAFLQKPFIPKTLAAQVRSLLDA